MYSSRRKLVFSIPLCAMFVVVSPRISSAACTFRNKGSLDTVGVDCWFHYREPPRIEIGIPSDFGKPVELEVHTMSGGRSVPGSDPSQFTLVEPVEVHGFLPLRSDDELWVYLNQGSVSLASDTITFAGSYDGRQGEMANVPVGTEFKLKYHFEPNSLTEATLEDVYDAPWESDALKAMFEVFLPGGLEPVLSAELLGLPMTEPLDCNGDGILAIADANCTSPDSIDSLLAALNLLHGDADGDGTVDFTDFLTLSANFGGAGNYTHGDFDKDGNIQFSDFLILSANFGQSVDAAMVPEPTAAMLLFWTGLVLMLRHRM